MVLGISGDRNRSLRLGIGTMRDLNENEWAYLAGLIDGEGSIYSTRIDRGSYIQHRVAVTITNTNEDMIRWCHNRLGGSLWVGENFGADKTHFRLGFYSQRDSRFVLDGVLPFLVAKKKQAELALTVLDTLPGSGGKKSKESSAMLDEIYHDMSRLNGAR